MPHYDVLPSETWLQIFRWATTSDEEFKFIRPHYTPFQSIPNHRPDSLLSTKRSIVLVCREWNRLATECLYKDLVLSVPSAPSKDILLKNKGIRESVVRVILPYPSTFTSALNDCSSILDTFNLCVNVKTLVRPRLILPESLSSKFGAVDFPAFQLERLDWHYYNDAERSGGLNSLRTILLNSKRLQYLSIGGNIGFGHFLMDTSTLPLLELQTLRLNLTSTLFLRRLVNQWHLPALNCIALDVPLSDEGMQDLWKTFGPQLHTVEFGKSVDFLTADHVSDCLKGCPTLNEIYVYALFTAIPNTASNHINIATIGLNAAANSSLEEEDLEDKMVMEAFVRCISISAYPSLRQIHLYGDWREILSHPALIQICQSLKDEGVEIIACQRY